MRALATGSRAVRGRGREQTGARAARTPGARAAPHTARPAFILLSGYRARGRRAPERGEGGKRSRAPTPPPPVRRRVLNGPWVLFNDPAFQGANLVADAKPLLTAGSARWSLRFSRGPLPVTMDCT